jgi:hypothetical protein
MMIYLPGWPIGLRSLATADKWASAIDYWSHFDAMFIAPTSTYESLVHFNAQIASS